MWEEKNPIQNAYHSLKSVNQPYAHEKWKHLKNLIFIYYVFWLISGVLGQIKVLLGLIKSTPSHQPHTKAVFDIGLEFNTVNSYL